MPIAAKPTAAVMEDPLEDPLEYLPTQQVTSHKKGQSLDLPAGLHLIQPGRVKVSYNLVVSDIYATEELIYASGRERAEFLAHTKLMSWSVPDVERVILARPRLGIALLQLMAAREQDRMDRIHSLAQERSPARVRRALLRFTCRHGVPSKDGLVEAPPLTHNTIAEYAGTTREVATTEMNRLRRNGVLKYSRRAITVHTQALREALEATA